MTVYRKAHDLARILVGAKAIIWETRSGRPVRTIVTGRRVNWTARYTSYKTGWTNPAESLPEVAMMWVSEVDPTIVRYVAQPHMLEILGGERSLRYHPDLRLDHVDGIVEIVEVKPDLLGRPLDTDYEKKLDLAAHVYEDLLGWKFTVVDAQELAADPAFANVGDIQRDRRTAFSIREELVVSAISQSHDPFTYGEAVEALGGFPVGKKILHAMMVRGVVSIDLSRRMTLETPVTWRGRALSVNGRDDDFGVGGRVSHPLRRKRWRSRDSDGSGHAGGPPWD